MSKQDSDMSFLDHLEIFRWHLIRSTFIIVLFSVVAFMFKGVIFDIILLAPTKPDFQTYLFLCKASHLLGMSDALCFRESPFTLININMSGQFSTHILVSFLSGFIFAFPYVFWEFWRFVSPALYAKESRVAKSIVFFGSALFMLGICFGYYVIAPLSINFLGSYQVSGLVSNQISLTSFISTLTTICFANGVIFELPILVYFLTKIGLLTPQFMRIYRRHSIVVILILSAIITPPDITSQILVSFPLIILYECSIYLCSRTLKNQKSE